MKNLYSLILLFILPIAGFAQFETPDENTTYTLADLTTLNDSVVTFDNGIYFINHPLIIAATDTLSITEELEVRIAELALVTIRGGFYVNSNTLFTKIDTTYAGFRFEDESVIHLEGATFEYGGGLRALTGNLTMIDCMVRYQTIKTSTSGAVGLSKGKPYFEGCTFFENQRSAIGGPANGAIAPIIVNCSLIGNGTLNGLRPQINLGPTGADTAMIMNNIITGYPENDRAGGIAFLAASATHAVVSGNVITNNQYGISFNGNAYTRIVGNIIENNNTGGNPMTGGSGINVLGNGDMNHVVLNNEIRGNLWGITTQGNGQINLGDFDDEEVGGGGNVFSENGNGGIIYAFYNNTPNAVTAQGNCWIEQNPEATEEEVAEVIFEQADDETLGAVDFSNFTCAFNICTAPTDLAASDITFESAQISWIAPETAPENGYEYYVSLENEAPTEAGLPTTDTSVDLTDLAENTTYYFWVRSACENEFSDWAGSESFLTDESTGLTDVALDRVANIYPNPTSGVLNIDLLDKTAETIAIYDLSGRVLEQINLTTSEDIKLDVSKFASGVYMIQISGNATVSTGKFVIQ